MKTPSIPSRMLDGMRKKQLSVFAIALIGLIPSLHAADATPSELLERGIYSEETKGDIDTAMQLYQQIVAEASTSQALAAQAQFRLAMCYDKKKDYAAATKAFEKLISDFPAQKDLVALANDYISEGIALLPVPWKGGEELDFQVKLPSGVKAGLGRFTVNAQEVNGRKIWQFGSQLYVGPQQWSRTEVDADSFKPIHSLWKHSLIGEAETSYTVGAADLKLTGQRELKHVDLAGAVYDNEQAIQLMRRLPLAVGYTTKLNLFSGLGGGVVLPIKLEVKGTESIQVPAGKFECYKVVLSIGQTYWYSADTGRYLVKYEASGIVGELSRVSQRAPGERMPMRDALLQFSFNTPPGGLAQRMEADEDTAHSSYLVLDAAGNISMNLKVEHRERFDEKVRASVRNFAEYKVERGKKFAKSFTVRPDSWREIVIAGQPGLTFVADFQQGEKTYVLQGAYGFVGENAVEFAYWSSPEFFEGFRPAFNAVVESYRGN